MNATCHCNEEMLRVHGMSALCEACAAEYVAWAEAQHAEAEGAAAYQRETLALRGAA